MGLPHRPRHLHVTFLSAQLALRQWISTALLNAVRAATALTIARMVLRRSSRRLHPPAIRQVAGQRFAREGVQVVGRSPLRVWACISTHWMPRSTRCGACDARAAALSNDRPMARALPRRPRQGPPSRPVRAKGDARAAIRTAEASPAEAPTKPTVSPLEFVADWERRFPRHPRTMATNRERLRLYIIPNLPRAGDIALGGIRRPMLRDVPDLGWSHPRVPPRSSLTRDSVMLATGG
jgi:hypothetical protein